MPGHHGGATKRPVQLKMLRNTVRKSDQMSDIIEFPVVEETPDAPEWLRDKEAIEEWDRLAPILVANGLLTTAGMSGFAMLCGIHGKLVKMLKRGRIPTGHLLAQYRALINDYGLTPVAQMKVKPGDPGKQKNKFANNGKR